MSILNKEKILEQARAFIDEGKYDKAIREYEKILVADPEDLRVKLRIAELYTKRKQINDAIRIYKEVAAAYEAEGFFLKAVTVHKNILRLNPSMTDINEQLGVLYEKMGLVSDAIRQYSIVATAFDSKGMGDRAVEMRERIVQLKPDDGTARVRLAESLQREGKSEESIDQYEEFARRIEKSGGEETRLADLYEKILAHRPDKKDFIRRLIDIYDSLGEKKKALKWLEAGSQFVEKDPRLLKLQAEVYASQNQNETARSKYMMLADLLKQKGDNDGSLDAYYEILVILPDEEDRLMNLVEELKPGAMPELVARALKRREELEAEQERKDVEASTGAPSGEKSEGEESSAPKTVPSKPKPTPAPKPGAVARVAAAAQAVPPRHAALKEADAAFDLGKVYQRMGLSDEAKAEFKKALSVYGTMAGTVLDTDAIKSRRQEIEDAIGIERGEMDEPGTESPAASAPKKAPERPARPAGTKSDKSPAPPKAKASKDEKPENLSAKKKISFV